MRLYVDVPLASWRSAYARQYWETWPVVPPSTVYGMLLSLVGEQDRFRHRGARLAVALLSDPRRSRVLRAVWKVDSLRDDPGVGPNIGPEWQEIFSDVRLCVWVGPGPSEQAPNLAVRVETVLRDPSQVVRFGGLALGESTFLVNAIRPWRGGDPAEGRLLRRATADEPGLALPVWVDHVESRGTRWVTFVLDPRAPLPEQPPEAAWVEVAPP